MSTATRAAAFTEPDRPDSLQSRFITLGSSYVDVTGPGEYSQHNRWNCHGCKETSQYPEENYLRDMRGKANAHAGICRAIPLS